METNHENRKDIRLMHRYYFAILGEVADVYGLDKNTLHSMMKVGYNVQTTTRLSYDERYMYLDNVTYFLACVFDIMFDSEGYRQEGIPYVWLFGSMKVDYPKPKKYKSLFFDK